MGPLDQLYHLANFLAPAFTVGLLLALVGSFGSKKSSVARGFITQAAINFIAGSLALGLGLWFFGHDGKMASYAAMLVVATTSQWAGGRGENLLDGGAPFYDTYETADGRHISIAPLEPKFFAELARLIGLPERFVQRQYDRRLWPGRRCNPAPDQA